MATERPGIPKTYDELYRNFGRFIVGEIRRYNHVQVNTEDAYQDVLCKLIEARFIEKFWEVIEEEAKEGALPETMTTPEVLQFFGNPKNHEEPLPWYIWQARLWRYHTGEKLKSGKRLYYRIPMPLPTNGVGYTSKDALWATSDIIALGDAGWYVRGVLPARKEAKPPSFYHFLNYLGKAVHNHFTNFCRTRDRRWRDIAGDAIHGAPPLSPKHFTDEGYYKEHWSTSNRDCTTGTVQFIATHLPRFQNEEGTYNEHWTDTIRDDSVPTQIDAHEVLAKAVQRLSDRGVEEAKQEVICEALADGCTIEVAVKRAGLTAGTEIACVRALSKLGFTKQLD